MSSSTSSGIIVCQSSDDLVQKLESCIKTSWEQYLSSGSSQQFVVAVSGGSLIKILSQALSKLRVSEIDGQKWSIVFVDERLVPVSDPESTYGSYMKDLLPCVNFLTKKNFLQIEQSLNGDPNSCAIEYEERLKSLVQNRLPFGKLDVVILGMGPDGHTASLFPNHVLLEESQKWIAGISDSPKPPPSRITMTFPVINSAESVIIVSTGASKADMLLKVFTGKPSKDIPISLVSPQNGKLTWLLDADASSKVPRDIFKEKSQN